MSGWIDNLNNLASSEHIDIQKNITQDQNLTPEEILASIDPDSEYYQQAVEEYNEFEKNKNETFSEQINSSQIALQDLRLEFQQDIEAIQKMDQLFVTFELEWKHNVVKEKFSEVFKTNDALEESFFTLIDTIWVDAVRTYIESRLSNPRRIDKRGVTRMIDGFQEEMNQNFELEINSLITTVKSSQDIEYIKQKIDHFPEIKKQEYAEILNKIKLNTENKESEDKDETLEDKDYTRNIIKKSKEKFNKLELKQWKAIQESLKNNIDFHSIDQDLRSKYWTLLNEMEVFSENDNISKEDIEKFSELLLWENSQFKDFLIDLWNTDIEQYEVFYNTFKDIPDFSNFIQNLESPDKLREKNNETILGKNTHEIYAEFYLWAENKRLWDKMYNNDKMVDLWEYPPKYYIVSQNWFKLETTVPVSNELDTSRKEYFSMQVQYNEEYNVQDDKLRAIEQEITIKKDAWIDTSELELQRQSVIDEMSDIKQKFEELEQAFKNHIDSYLQEHQNQLKQKERVAIEVKDFISSIWFDLIPQNIVDSVLNQLNSNNWLRSSLWFTTEFNLKEWILWFEDTSNDDILSSKEKVKFAELYNIIISWKKWEPLDIDNIRNWSWVPFEDRNTFQGQLEKTGLKDSGTWISVAMNNLENSLQNTEK